MAKPLTDLFRTTIERELPELQKLSDEAAAVRPNGEASWSPKEELGHLIDSAANNHMRFVRGALDGVYRGPGYAQNDWVTIHGSRIFPKTGSPPIVLSVEMRRPQRSLSSSKTTCFTCSTISIISFGVK
jgi:hypothetical protein